MIMAFIECLLTIRHSSNTDGALASSTQQILVLLSMVLWHSVLRKEQWPVAELTQGITLQPPNKVTFNGWEIAMSKKDPITLAISQFRTYSQSSVTCKVNSKTFWTPIAIHLLTDFTQLNCEALRAMTMFYSFLYFLILHGVCCRVTHNKC